MLQLASKTGMALAGTLLNAAWVIYYTFCLDLGNISVAASVLSSAAKVNLSYSLGFLRPYLLLVRRPTENCK